MEDRMVVGKPGAARTRVNRTGAAPKSASAQTPPAVTSPASEVPATPDVAAQARVTGQVISKRAPSLPAGPPKPRRLSKVERAAHDAAIARDTRRIAGLLPQMLCDLGGVDDVSKLGVRPLVASAGKDSLFNCLFGRDSIRMAIDVIDSHPAVALSTIVELARLQGTKTNDKAEEEPGRIIHEYRDAEGLERIRQFEPDIDKWDFPYYGSVDATPAFVMLIGEYVRRFGKEVLDLDVNTTKDAKARFGTAPRTVRQALDAALSWLEGRMDDPRAGGFLWVQRANPHGIGNQILEDSRDSVYSEDGHIHPTTLPYAPIAEQGYAWRALLDAAAMLEGDERSTHDAAALRARADLLKEQIVRVFWQDDLSTFAQAIGFDERGAGTPMRTIASSPGQLLRTGLLDEGRIELDGRTVEVAELRRRLVDRLFQPDMLAGAGIRTKSTRAARFLAGGYHNGTVWPTISLEIKDGLLHCAERVTLDAEKARAFGDEKAAARHTREAKDLFAKAHDLEDRAIRACARFPFFPEFFRGDPDGSIAVNTEVKKGVDRDGHLNTFEQPPQPQGWTATALDKILRQRQARADGPSAASTLAQATTGVSTGQGEGPVGPTASG
jgi:glycogen debranching enzyme